MHHCIGDKQLEMKEDLSGSFINPFDDEMVSEIHEIEDDMRDAGIDEIKIERAVKDIGGPGFWCHKYHDIYMRNEGTCGRFCNGYKPRNGISGICKHWGHTFVGTGEMITYSIK